MADHPSEDSDLPRRPRRGPPPRLYVIARRSPFPWLRVRRLGPADQAALRAHVARLAAGLPGSAARAAGPDFGRVTVFGALAGNAVVAAACGVPGPDGLEVAVTEDPAYRDRGLGAMLVSQLLGAEPAGTAAAPCPGDAECALLQLLRSIGTQVEPSAAAALDLAQSA